MHKQMIVHTFSQFNHLATLHFTLQYRRLYLFTKLNFVKMYFKVQFHFYLF